MSAILVVDDDPDIRQLLAELLRLSGHEPITVGSGVEALERLADEAIEQPALVILDVQMPELDGWDTLRAIRARPRTADLPVLLCTVKSGHVDSALGWSLGCDGYVLKPFAIADLTAEVDSVIALSSAERAARREAALRVLREDAWP